MSDIPAIIKDRLERLKIETKEYLQLKVINNRFCVYRGTSIWDKVERKNKKVTIYKGVITPEGEYIPKKPRSKIAYSDHEIYQSGNANLAYAFLKDTELILNASVAFPQEIVAAAIINSISPRPLRLFSSTWETFDLSRKMDVNLAPKHMSAIYKDLGRQISCWYDMFGKLMDEDSILLYDMSSIFSYSENISLAEKGRNPDHLFVDQIGIVMAFSTNSHLPVGLDVYSGSIKDISTIREFVKRLPERNVGFIFDRGFSSYALLKDLRKDHIHFLVPLTKDSKYMDTRWIRWVDPFVYRKRPIRWGRKECDLGNIYFFDDPKLRGEQEMALLRSVEKKKITMKEYEELRDVAGIFGIITDLEEDGFDIYDMYKGREDVELGFDAMKHYLDSDKTYMESSEAVRGFFFITFLALRVYFKVLQRLRAKEMTSKISVAEVFQELGKIQKIIEKSGKEYYAVIPKRARGILEMFPEAIPMG